MPRKHIIFDSSSDDEHHDSDYVPSESSVYEAEVSSSEEGTGSEESTGPEENSDSGEDIVSSEYNDSDASNEESSSGDKHSLDYMTLKRIKNNIRRFMYQRVYARVLDRFEAFKCEHPHARDCDFIQTLRQEALVEHQDEHQDLSSQTAKTFTEQILLRIADELEAHVHTSSHTDLGTYLKSRVQAYQRLKITCSEEQMKQYMENKEDRVLVRQIINRWGEHLSKKECILKPLAALSTEEKRNCWTSLRTTIGETKDPMLIRILQLKTTTENRSEILDNYKKCCLAPDNTKRSAWIEGACRIPFGIMHAEHSDSESFSQKPLDVLQRSQEFMDTAIHGHDRAKRTIRRLLAQRLSKPDDPETSMIALSGPPGVGKTTLIKNGVAKALDRPFFLVSLGGVRNASFLVGHQFTWEGSTCGKIVETLQQAKSMDPVILFDEVDKISDTPRGEEIVNCLIHIIDRTQNSHFQDRYFSGLNIDLSRVTFMFSLNDPRRLNPILRDRMKIVNLDGFTIPTKIAITRHSLWERALDTVGLPKRLLMPDNVLETIIHRYTFESGVRRLEEILLEIAQELNLRRYELNGNKRRRNTKVKRITISLVQDILKDRRIIEQTCVRETPQIGAVNGMWAGDSGMGGILPIQARIIPTREILALRLTGNQGKTMQESMEVAKTLAWDMLDDKIKRRWLMRWKRNGPTGFHIHCPEGGVPKDGPSAGIAITVCLLSLLTEKPVDNRLAMTGEITLVGHVGKIGGLHEKLRGAKQAGVKHVLVPQENERDLETIRRRDPGLFESKKFSATLVQTITDVLQHTTPKRKRKRKRVADNTIGSEIACNFVVPK